MNFKQMMVKQLGDRGMFDNDAERLVEHALSDKSFCTAMEGHWNKPIADYPTAMCATILMELWPAALKWIEANQPNAWYLVQFTPEYQKLSGKERDAYVDDFHAIRDLTLMSFAPKVNKNSKKSWSRPSNKKKRSR